MFNNSEFKRDLNRRMKNTSIGELSPGVTPRRYTPPGGEKQHRERIHRESKFADEHKNLPFSFSKPVKPKRHKFVECDSCGSIFYVPVNTVGVVCRECKKFSSVSEVVNA